jgi:dethiobiotin synthetase
MEIMRDDQVKKHFFVTGIGTDVGKTVVSAILAEALECAYWKPIQAGDLDNSDSIKIKNLTNNVDIYLERFKFQNPLSPHAAAKIDHFEVKCADIEIPESKGRMLIEGAGGLMVPFNDEAETWLDFLKKENLKVILVSRHYLGSINHTLMTAEILKVNNIEIDLLVFVGDEVKATEEVILNKTGIKNHIRIPITDKLDKHFVHFHAGRVAELPWFRGLKK